MKHTTVQPPGGGYVFRLDSLGAGYTEAHIRERLAAARRGEPYEMPAPPSTAPIPPVRPVPQVRRRYTVRWGAAPRQPRRKLRGFRALYMRYLYILNSYRKPRRTPPPAAIRIKAVWHDEGGPCWTFETDIPHETFTIFENGEPWCIGIVFSMADVNGKEVQSDA